MSKISKGLTAHQAQKSLTQYGLNEISEKRSTTPVTIFVSQFNNVLVMLLILAAAASVFLDDIVDGVFIFLIVILNSILGFAQEYKAERAVAALKQMIISQVRVLRDGKQQEIDSRLLVPKDVVVLEAGDKVPADCDLIESLHLEVNEASLTGESLPVEKNVTAEGKKHLYLGTIIAKGRCLAEVAATGMETKFGKIAATLSHIKKEDTPLQKKLNRLGKQLGILGIASSMVVFIFGFLNRYPLWEMVLTSISLAVAAVPEGLPAVLTITLAVGMQRMAKHKAILRKLSSIEALGNTSVIATDKTGTLTRNEMKVTKLYYDGKLSSFAHNGPFRSDKTFSYLLKAAVVCNTASLIYKHDSGSHDVLGDTTEGALLVMASELSLDYEDIRAMGVLTEEYAFDPLLRLMSVGWRQKQANFIYSKGAPESILSICKYYLMGGEKITLNEQNMNKFEQEYKKLAEKGLRILAFSYKEVPHMPSSRKQAESDQIFLGFAAIADPPRPEVKQALEIADKAGIETIMITGDNELTANAVATEIGLIKENEEIITGKQFEALDEDQALQQLSSIRIFARTSPDLKYRIVQLLQKKGNIVAVTGDGVNDALALKQADVGVAMGITGTDVAKEASDMIITDDNYATIVTAIEEGRTIFENIKSAIKYLIGCNLGEVIAVLVGLLLGWPVILSPLQLLYINLVTDGLPAIALAIHPKHEGIMTTKPRATRGIFDRLDYIWLAEMSSITAITTLVSYYVGDALGGTEIARTFAFTTLILAQQFILLNVWIKDEKFIQKKLYSSPLFLIAFITPLFLQPLLIYIPVLAGIFKLSAVSVVQLIFIVLLSATILFTAQLRKVLFAKRRAQNVS